MMKGLLEIHDELNVARNFVECAYAACHHIDDADGIIAVLDAASEKMKAIIGAIDAMKAKL